jgi:hypothetical protein
VTSLPLTTSRPSLGGENQIKRVQGKVTAGEAVLREINGLMSKYLKKKGRVLTTEERMNLDSYELPFQFVDT